MFTPVKLPLFSRLTIAFAAMLLLAAGPLAHAAGPTFPELTGQVVDQANIIPEEMELQLIGQLAALEAKSSDQVVVVTVPSLQDYPIEEYGYQLGREMQIGQGERLNNGVILLVAPNERKVRIEVGYGLEGVLTDLFAAEIIRDNIIPAFKAGDMPAGISAGVTGIEAVLTADPVELQARAARGLSQKGGGREEDPLAVLIILIFLGIWLWVAFASMRARHFRRSSPWNTGPIIVHDWNDRDRGSGWGSGWGGGSGGGFGGGGFSGGGGSFGGGGASGSW